MLREIHAVMQDTGNIHMVVSHRLFHMAGACRPASIGSSHHTRHPSSSIHPQPVMPAIRHREFIFLWRHPRHSSPLIVILRLSEGSVPSPTPHIETLRPPSYPTFVIGHPSSPTVIPDILNRASILFPSFPLIVILRLREGSVPSPTPHIETLRPSIIPDIRYRASIWY
jgi:hypothetical protein